MQVHMSEVWGQAWISATPTGKGTIANGTANESGLESVLPIATGKIVTKNKESTGR
jgi:hypothetical protein